MNNVKMLEGALTAVNAAREWLSDLACDNSQYDYQLLAIEELQWELRQALVKAWDASQE